MALISIVFVPSEPTINMWKFAHEIAKALDLPLPKYEYETVSEFLGMYSEEFYSFKRIVDYDYWNHAFWMDPRQIIGDDD